MIGVCAKRQRHCGAYLALKESALKEWAMAETLGAVLASWGRFGGRVTLHRYGRDHYREMGRRSGLARRHGLL